MIRFTTSRLIPGSLRRSTAESSQAPAAPEIANLLLQSLDAQNEHDAIDAVNQIPDIDTARRIHAYVDIYLTFKDAMTEESVDELREIIVDDMLKFSGQRLPEDLAEKVGVPEELINVSPNTGVIDYVDIQAAVKVWDEVSRSEAVASVIAAFIQQYSDATTGHEKEAALLGEAFHRSLINGSKMLPVDFDLTREIEKQGKPNRFTDNDNQHESLRIAAERDHQRKLQRELTHAASR